VCEVVAASALAPAIKNLNTIKKTNI
jgi:hypothetical protein